MTAKTPWSLWSAGLALLASGCISDEESSADTDTVTQPTCAAVCPKLIDCWKSETGSASAGDAYGYGYAYYGYYGSGYGYLNDDRLGDFTYAGYACGYGYGDGYASGYAGGCDETQVRTRAVEMCLQGCYANTERNAGQVQCLAEQACPDMLRICVGADIGYGY